MFTLNQIKEAHAKVRSGADFPAYVQELIQLGVVRYESYVSDGHTEYTGTDRYEIRSAPRYEPIPVADISDHSAFKRYLKIHQEGHTNYLQFCVQAGETGVEKWEVDTKAMTCTYYDKAGGEILVEQIPVPRR